FSMKLPHFAGSGFDFANSSPRAIRAEQWAAQKEFNCIWNSVPVFSTARACESVRFSSRLSDAVSFIFTVGAVMAQCTDQRATPKETAVTRSVRTASAVSVFFI